MDCFCGFFLLNILTKNKKVLYFKCENQRGCKMQKRVNFAIFDILKSVVDSRMPDLVYRNAHATAAKEKISSLQSQIRNLQKFAEINRYDSSDVKDATGKIVDCEYEIKELEKSASNLHFVRSELNASAEFYHIYDAVSKSVQLQKYYDEYARLNEKADDLSELMFACDINNDPKSRSSDICNQAIADYEMYTKSYDETIDRINILRGKIAELQR